MCGKIKNNFYFAILGRLIILIKYVEEALKRAGYKVIEDDEPYYVEIYDLPGVWATDSTLEECRDNLKETSEQTVKSNVSHLLEKLNLRDRTQLANYALRNNLV